MINERKNKLLESMKNFNKKNKSEIFTFGNEIEELEVIPTGIKMIDDFLGGGFKQGGHTIVWGMYSVGKTALILTTIANAQKTGKLVCYVNTEKPIEPERFKFFGIKLDEMVYIEAPENAEQALEAMRTLCKDKVIDLFIIDSTNGLCPKSVQETAQGVERSLEKKNVASLALTLSNFYNAVNAHVFRSRASIIWIGQSRIQGIGTFFTRAGLSGGGAQEFYAYQIVFMRRGQNSDAPVKKYKVYFYDPDGKLRYQTKNEAIGFDVVMRLDKTNSCKSKKEKSEIHIPFYYETGFKIIQEQEELPIKIEADNDEDYKKIESILIEKGILENPFKPLKADQIIVDDVMPEKTVKNHLKEKSEEFQEKVKENTKKLKKEIIKKKRGRPKKT